MNSKIKEWLDARIVGLDAKEDKYNDHIDQFFNKEEWANVFDDCIMLYLEAIEYLSSKSVSNAVVILNIPLIQRNKFMVEYDIDLTIDIPNFIFDSRLSPPSIFILRETPIITKKGMYEEYIRPIVVDKRLSRWDCTAVYFCCRDFSDIKDDYPFFRDIQYKCYL